METPPDTAGNYEVALANARKGVVSIPCRPGTKVPLVKWKRYQTEMPTREQFAEWFMGTRNNIAVITTGLVVFDCDDAAVAGLVLRECGDTPHKLRTPQGGIHLGYRKRKGVVVRNQVKIKGQPIDIRTDGGLEVIPFSSTEHGAYRWLGEGLKPIAELPVAKVGWTRERTRRQVQHIAISDDQDLRVRRAGGYIAHIVSVSGRRGHDACFRAACKLRDFGLTAAEAWPVLVAWNETNAKPPWSERELRHKLTSAFGQ